MDRIANIATVAFLCSLGLSASSLSQESKEERSVIPTTIPESTDEKAAFMILVADRDGDGKIARSEAPGAMYRENFDRFDINGDDILDLNEVKNAAKQLQKSPAMVARMRAPLEQLDANGDGMISQAEAEADREFAKGFAKADLDQDGQLSEYEVAAKVRTQEVLAFQKTYDPAAEPKDEKRKPFITGLGRHWSGASNSGEYRLGLDRSVALSGDQSAYIKATHGSRSFAQFNQLIDAVKYAGKRVELSAQIKVNDVENGTGVAGVWMRVDGSRMRAFDNMKGRGITESDDWQSALVVLDIPDDAVRIAVGGILTGTGTAWFDDFKLRVVDESISVTQPTTELPESDHPTAAAVAAMKAATQDRALASLQDGSFEATGRKLGIRIAENLEIVDIFNDSPSQKLGIQVGDKLLRIDDEKIESTSDFVASLYAGDGERTLHVMRDGREVSFKFETADTETKHPSAAELPTASSPRSLPRMTEESAKQYVARLDSDGDGLISEDEARGGVARNFQRYDKNSDGGVDADEILKSGLRVSSGRGNIFETLLVRNDSDQDGKLSLAELPQFFYRFKGELDKDSNGFVTKDELNDLPNIMQRNRPSSTGNRGGQRSDPDFKPSVTNPEYSADNAPRIAIDAGHQNFHTKDGRYQPFASVLEADGASVVEHSGVFTEESLARIDILVIANALPENRGRDVASAFSNSEIKTLVKWIENGGALFLLADHAPYGKAAERLGKALGVEMTGGFVLGPDKTNAGQITFTKDNNSLAAHAISGGDEAAQINQVVSFTGQAIRGNEKYQPILILPPGVTYRANRGRPVADGNDAALPNLAGWHQGIAGQLGKGRVVVFGEAGMFSAQVSVRGSKMGMSAEGAEQNQQLLLNVIHWLNGDI